ncbi:MAG: hypothetical protein GX154_06905 [Clostridiales bacterium]|nr:hypothetical protein [Clostridiales bacterium]
MADKKYHFKFSDFLRKQRRNSKFFIIFIFVIFLIIKLSLFNYLNLVSISEAKYIIRDFEKNYMYQNVFNNSSYAELKNNLLSGSFTTKAKIYDMETAVKVLAGDKYTEIKYVDFLRGKFEHSLNRKMKFNKKNLGKNIIYIKISSFGENAASKFTKAIENRKNRDFLILDLRGNKSGNYIEAIEIANDLLPPGLEIVQIEGPSSKHCFNSNSIYYDFKKIYILLDGDCGYCSEIVALSLKDNLKNTVYLIGGETSEIEIGSVYRIYKSRIAINIASLKWNTNGKVARELGKHIISVDDIKPTESENEAALANVIKLIK